jgi:L-fuconolactonase
MTDAVAPIRRRFDVDDLRAVLHGTGVEKTVVVQSRCDTAETYELLAVADADGPVAGVVGWLDLTAPRALRDEIAAFRTAPGGAALVGVRHLVQDEVDPRWLLREPVQASLDELGREGLVYDLVVRPPQLPAALQVVAAHPDTRFVVDHLAKPRIAAGDRDPEWAAVLRELSTLPNVWCKLSGLVTEADRDGWTVDQLRPYVELAAGWFGDDRLLFGSDWPVCTLAASYREVLDALQELLAGATASAREKILGLNAIAVYGL